MCRLKGNAPLKGGQNTEREEGEGENITSHISFAFKYNESISSMRFDLLIGLCKCWVLLNNSDLVKELA